MVLSLNLFFYYNPNNKKILFFLLMSVLSQSFFAFMSRHLMSFPFFTTWHNPNE